MREAPKTKAKVFLSFFFKGGEGGKGGKGGERGEGGKGEIMVFNFQWERREELVVTNRV